VLWTRAILDADNASTKLIIEYLDGKPGETEGAPGKPPAFHADDLALAGALLPKEIGNDDGERGRHGEGVALPPWMTQVHVLDLLAAHRWSPIA
jgi:hypothetical protein